MPEPPHSAGSDLIAKIDSSALTATSLAQLYREGAALVLLDVGDWVRRMWQDLVETTDEVLPWQLPLADIAANHHGSSDITTTLGDVAYFQPGHHGYIARKIEVGLDATGVIRAQPCFFQQNGITASPSREAVIECWNMANRIMHALAARGRDDVEHKVAIQRLKYQGSAQEFAALAIMTRNSLARWSRLGYQIDVNRGTLHHRLSTKWISDALGVMMLAVPRGQTFVRRVNDALLSKSARQAGDNYVVVERAHTDHRYFSALCGKRHSVRTEFFARGQWHEVPVGLDFLTIMPGFLAKERFGIEPLLHRVVYPVSSEEAVGEARTNNVTLLLGSA